MNRWFLYWFTSWFRHYVLYCIKNHIYKQNHLHFNFIFWIKGNFVISALAQINFNICKHITPVKPFSSLHKLTSKPRRNKFLIDEKPNCSGVKLFRLTQKAWSLNNMLRNYNIMLHENFSPKNRLFITLATLRKVSWSIRLEYPIKLLLNIVDLV